MPDTPITYNHGDWRLDAACRNVDTATFFPESDDGVAAAGCLTDRS